MTEKWVELMQYGQMIRTKFQNIITHVAQREGISSNYLLILLAIDCQQLDTIGKVAQHLAMRQTNVSTLCKQMEQDGLIQRCRNSADVRVVNVSLTPQGQQIMVSLKQFLKALETKIKQQYDAVVDGEALVQGAQAFQQLVTLIEKELT